MYFDSSKVMLHVTGRMYSKVTSDLMVCICTRTCRYRRFTVIPFMTATTDAIIRARYVLSIVKVQ